MIVDVEGICKEILKEIRSSKNIEGVVQECVKKKEDGWQAEEGLILNHFLIYIPNDKALHNQIIHEHHDTRTLGHPRQYKTLEKIQRTYWWPRIHIQVKVYVHGCKNCQRTKLYPSKLMGLLMPNHIPECNWQIISVDLITQLLQSMAYDAIFVIINCLSEMIPIVPTNS